MNDHRGMNLDALKEKFDFFLFEMSDALEALHADAEAIGRPELLPLDYSFESLDRLEAMYALILEDQVSVDIGGDLLATRIARYLGETLRKQVGGVWDFCRDSKDINYGNPCLIQIPNLPKTYRFYPLVVVTGFRNARHSGWFRKLVGRHDLEYMREWFTRFQENMESELRALVQYVESLNRPELLPLDSTIDSLDRLEGVLTLALDHQVVPPDGGLDRLIEQIARYMGEMYRRSAGGEWQLCEDPRNIDFGLPRVRFFCPAQICRNFLMRRKSGLIRQATEYVIDTNNKT